MNKKDDKPTLEKYFDEIQTEMKALNKDDIDENELKNLINLINSFKLDYDIDFHECFKNQMYYIIKSDGYQNSFDFKFKENTNILNFIFNYATSINALKQEIQKKIQDNKKSKNTKDLKNIQNNINIINEDNNTNWKEKDIQDNNSNSQIKNNSSNSGSNPYFSLNRTNLYDSNFSPNNSQEIKNNDSKDLKNDQKNKDININLEKKVKSIENVNNIQNDKLNEIKKKEKKYENLIFFRKDYNFDNNGRKKDNLGSMNKEMEIRNFEDTSKILGKGFEYDTINYIFMQIYSVAVNKDFSIVYNFSPDMEKINQIFKAHELYTLNDIQFDFIINNLVISDFIKLLINIYPGIHPNSKLGFIFKNKFFTLENLISLEQNEEYKNEKIDIIGEVGKNIFNEQEKCEQLLKYSQLIHNINCLIRKEKEDLYYLLDSLHLNNSKKKLLLFIILVQIWKK